MYFYAIDMLLLQMRNEGTELLNTGYSPVAYRYFSAAQNIFLAMYNEEGEVGGYGYVNGASKHYV